MANKPINQIEVIFSARRTCSLPPSRHNLRASQSSPPPRPVTSVQDPADVSSAGTRTGGRVTFGNQGGSSRHINNSNSDNSGRPSLLSLGAALRRQNEDTAQKVSTLQRSGVGTVTVLRKMEAAVQALSTKDLFWQVSISSGRAWRLLNTLRSTSSVEDGCSGHRPAIFGMKLTHRR